MWKSLGATLFIFWSAPNAICADLDVAKARRFTEHVTSSHLTDRQLANESGDDEVCKAPGACRTANIVREAGWTKFELFRDFTFEPLATWIKRSISESLEGRFLRFEYERADGGPACSLSFFKFGGSSQPDFDTTWWIFIGIDIERGEATIVAQQDNGVPRGRTALVKYNDGRAEQVELRQFEVGARNWMYELTTATASHRSNSINKTDPDIAACHVKRQPV